MATLVNEKAIKELESLELVLKTKFEEFILENTLATKKKVISSSKKARSLMGELTKLGKSYRKLSLAAFDKDPETKAKMKAKRDKRKEANGGKLGGTKTTTAKAAAPAATAKKKK